MPVQTPRWLPAIPACAGMVIGLYDASRDVLANDYLTQGLWRTALRATGDACLIGALAGLGAGLFMALRLGWRRPPEEDPGAGRLGVVLTLSVALALALLAVPADASPLFGLASLWAFRGGLTLLWALMVAPLLPRSSDPARAAEAPEGAWAVIVWLGYGVGLSQLWARLAPGALMVGLAGAGLLAALGLWAGMQRPVLALSAAVGRRLTSAAARRAVQGAMVLLALGVALGLAGRVVTWQARRQAGRAHRNLLIIAVDTLREDRVSLLSPPASGWDLTPNLRAHLSSRGTYFRRAYAQAPWTMPSFASIFTGLYPEEHGAEERVRGLASSHLTLAEILRDDGYRTMAVVSGEYVTTALGMLQGFEITDESHISGVDDVTSAAVTDRARALLSRHGDEPFFLFAHYFDPHFNYQRHPEFGFSSGLNGTLVPPGTPKLEPLGFPHHGPDFDELKARYAEEIAYTDRQIGRLLTLLDDRHLWDSTCVIFVADHGEEFAEHGGFEHGDTLFNELVHVPLLVADPARTGPAVRDDVVETRSVFSTALERLGLRLPASPVPPPTLTTARKEGQAFARSSARGVGSCLIGPRYKLVEGSGALGARVTLKAPPGAGWRQLAAGRREVLFDLLHDPRETTNLSLMRPDVTSRLRASLEAIARGLRPQASRASRSTLDQDQLRKLRDLGYLK